MEGSYIRLYSCRKGPWTNGEVWVVLARSIIKSIPIKHYHSAQTRGPQIFPPTFCSSAQEEEQTQAAKLTYGLSLTWEELEDLPKTALAVEVPTAAMASQSGIFIADAAPG